jgi:NTP pyrophosphatase (non-canonical NTP hydrolase)
MSQIMAIKKLLRTAHQNAIDKGFWEDENFNVSEKLMLIVSELGEAQEADRKDRYADLEKFKLEKKALIEKSKHSEVENPELSEAVIFQIVFQSLIKDTFEDELADVAIRIFDLCGKMDINLEQHILLKMRYNSMRPHKHGKKY